MYIYIYMSCAQSTLLLEKQQQQGSNFTSHSSHTENGQDAAADPSSLSDTACTASVADVSVLESNRTPIVFGFSMKKKK